MRCRYNIPSDEAYRIDADGDASRAEVRLCERRRGEGTAIMTMTAEERATIYIASKTAHALRFAVTTILSLKHPEPKGTRKK